MINTKRITPYPVNSEKKDYKHACYVILVNKKITIKISLWEEYQRPDYKVEVDPSNAVNAPAIQYFKWSEDNADKVYGFLKDILNRDVKYATLNDLKEIKKALKFIFKRIAKKTESA